MQIPAPLRTLLPLIIGLLIGAAGGVLFFQSLPGAEGSPEARAEKAESELKRAQLRLTELEASPRRRERAGRTLPIRRGTSRRTSARGGR